MADYPLRAEPGGIGEDVVHGESSDPALQHPAAHKVFVDPEIFAFVLENDD